MTIIYCLLYLQLKHLILDWFWQPPYEYGNKGTYWHRGGLQHAAKAGIGTGVILTFFFGPIGILLGVVDAVVHYHIDWAKVNINRYFGWDANTHAQFWWLTGFDQYLHQITFLGLLSMVVR